MLERDDIRFAIDDARRRHAALVDLINNSDRMALGLMQLYVALASAAISGTAAIYFGFGMTGSPGWLAWVLLSLGVPLAIGAALCLAALWPSNINLPGQQMNFWQWAAHPDVAAENAFNTLLSHIAEGHTRNEKINRRVSRLMYAAKICGALGPLFALAMFLYGAMTR
jgi:hypothetical protein